MKRPSVSKWLGPLSMMIALTSGAGCGGGSGVTLPPASMAPPGVTFEGGEFGESCSGDVYATAGIGWAFCDEGTWAYTTSNPAEDGFTELSAEDAGSPPLGGGFSGSGGGQ